MKIIYDQLYHFLEEYCIKVRAPDPEAEIPILAIHLERIHDIVNDHPYDFEMKYYAKKQLFDPCNLTSISDSARKNLIILYKPDNIDFSYRELFCPKKTFSMIDFEDYFRSEEERKKVV